MLKTLAVALAPVLKNIPERAEAPRILIVPLLVKLVAKALAENPLTALLIFVLVLLRVRVVPVSIVTLDPPPKLTKAPTEGVPTVPKVSPVPAMIILLALFPPPALMTLIPRAVA